MAENVYVKLQAKSGPIMGESTRHSQQRADLIECRQIYMGARTPVDSKGVCGVGSVTFDEFVMIKPIDKASVLIYQCLCNCEPMTLEALFFRPSQTDGSSEHFYSIIGSGGRITSISQATADGMDPNAANEEPCETVCFKFESITFAYPTASLEFGYSRSESD